LLLTPDNNIDRSGYKSGNTLKLVNLAGLQDKGKAVTLSDYGSTGELAVSADGNTALAVSWYVPAHFLVHDGTVPPFPAQILVLRIAAIPEVEAVQTIRPSGLNIDGWMENRRPRLSADGSVVALAQDGGVVVFARNIRPK